MTFEDGSVKVEVTGTITPETEKFVCFLLRMMNKGVGNPAYQLHAISVLTTGMSFVDLVVNSGNKPELVEQLNSIANSFLDSMKRSGSTLMSGATIDDFLNRE
jgi:hypothetical protein